MAFGSLHLTDTAFARQRTREFRSERAAPPHPRVQTITPESSTTRELIGLINTSAFSLPMFTVRGMRELCEFTQRVLELRLITSALRKRAGRERQRSGNRQSLIIEQFWRKVPRRSQLCSFVAVSGRSRRLLQGRSRSLEAVPVDAQLSYFRFKCLSWNSQLNGGASWTPNRAFGFPECGFEHFSFVLGKVSNERNRRHS